MSVRPIILLGDPRLRLKGLPVESFGRFLHGLLDDMTDTMRHAPGVGLAAPQVGEALQACVIEVRDTLYELVNPRIVRAAGELAAEGPGDILVFLAGEREIRETAEALRKHHPPETQILPLYSRLSSDEQMRIFQPHNRRRIVLATNVAETSLTVPGIRYVIDPGFARMSRYSARTKVQRLPIESISRASAEKAA